MPLSISNSDPTERAALHRVPRYARAAGITILLLALFIVGLEAVTRIGFNRISRIESRTAKEHLDARDMRPVAKPNVLLLGNSLLLEGLDYQRIQKDLSGEIGVTRFVIEGTLYYDWYYGIRRLLADGSRPTLIVLCLSPLQLIQNNIPNDYLAYYLFQAGDIPELSRVTHAGLTKASSLMLARYSLFYAGRNNLRNFILNHTYAPYGEFLHGIRTTAGKFPPSEAFQGVIQQRLRALNEECARYHVQFAFLIPPAVSVEGEAETLQAGRQAGAPVLRPIPGGVFTPDLFNDGFHLNARGAAAFTSALEQSLEQYLKIQTGNASRGNGELIGLESLRTREP